MTTTNTTTEWLSLASVADELGLSTRTVRRMIDAGYVAAQRIGKRAIRIHRAELDAYLAMNRISPPMGNTADEGTPDDVSTEETYCWMLKSQVEELHHRSDHLTNLAEDFRERCALCFEPIPCRTLRTVYHFIDAMQVQFRAER